MLRCVFPFLLINLSIGKTSVKSIAKTIGRSENAVRKKLAGDTEFCIDEAMAIQERFFPDCEIKTIFEKVSGEANRAS